MFDEGDQDLNKWTVTIPEDTEENIDDRWMIDIDLQGFANVTLVDLENHLAIPELRGTAGDIVNSRC